MNRSLLPFLNTTLGYGEYLGLPAVLSEELYHLGESVVELIMRRENFGLEYEKEIWVLGASHNITNKLKPKKSIKCGEDFCYKKSLDEKKICRPGTLYFYLVYNLNGLHLKPVI